MESHGRWWLIEIRELRLDVRELCLEFCNALLGILFSNDETRSPASAWRRFATAMALPPAWPRWREEFGLNARKAPQLAVVELADRGENEPPAPAPLRDLVRPPDGMVAIELDDGRRVFAPAGAIAATVKRQLAGKEKAP
ncbi:hypothetical protein NKI04_28395 [Mesorhizobium sp. M0814]|uniref:hypothetical protein n=1 Tax=Mesorhizobium sp. M0814 TaxID=2957004 RepID=UPI00333AF432